MTHLQISAAALAAGLLMTGAAHAQTLNDPAQLKREHNRAVAAHDPANDPYNPHSANALNRKQLERAQALGTGPGVPDDSYRVPYDSSTTRTSKPPVAYNSDDEPTNVTPNDALPPPNSSSFGQPDTNPQSSGTPTTDTPVTQPVDK